MLPTETVTTVKTASTTVSTYASSSPKTSTTASSAIESKTSMITSAVSHTVSDVKTTGSSVAAVKVTTADTNKTPIATTTDINEIDCEEVIRMKVDYVKKYLAALSAAAIASSGNPISANAESLFTPKALDPKVDSILYIEDNLDIFDFDGNEKINTMDAYALYTYVNDASELPEGYAERCEAKGDVNSDGKVDFVDSNIFREYCLLKFSLSLLWSSSLCA